MSVAKWRSQDVLKVIHKSVHTHTWSMNLRILSWISFTAPEISSIQWWVWHDEETLKSDSQWATKQLTISAVYFLGDDLPLGNAIWLTVKCLTLSLHIKSLCHVQVSFTLYENLLSVSFTTMQIMIYNFYMCTTHAYVIPPLNFG
jgi:hypothetical protein